MLILFAYPAIAHLDKDKWANKLVSCINIHGWELVRATDQADASRKCTEGKFDVLVAKADFFDAINTAFVAGKPIIAVTSIYSKGLYRELFAQNGKSGVCVTGPEYHEIVAQLVDCSHRLADVIGPKLPGSTSAQETAIGGTTRAVTAPTP